MSAHAQIIEAPANEPTVAGPASVLQVIARAASDPNTDVEKLERLMLMYERLSDRDARGAYYGALAEMQPKLPVINERGGIENKAGGVQSTYAKWEDINDAIRPLLAEYGFALSFRTGRGEGGAPTVTGVLSHKGGHAEETTMELPVDSSGSKNAVQAVGSSTSYGKRYTAIALLNITTRGEDDDGKSGGASAAEGAAIAAINMFHSTAEFAEWKRDTWPAAQKNLSTAEQNRVIAHFNTRFKRVKGEQD